MAQGKLIFICQTWPEPATTGAGVRTMQLVKCLQEAGFEIIMASTATLTEFSIDPELYGVALKPVRLNDSAFDDWIGEVAPEVVIFDRFMTEEQFGWRVESAMPAALRILDTQDIHSLRLCREETLGPGSEFSTRRWLQHEGTLREMGSIYRSDCSLIISSFEFQLLCDLVKIDPVLLFHLPFMLPPVRQESLLSFNERDGFVFMGNGRHKPNVDAIHWLKSDIWPGIRKQLPLARLEVYGAYMPPEISQLHQPENGFHIMGWVNDSLSALGRAKIQLAPLRFGAGIKGKLAESMQSGTPSVTTGIGAEGMHNHLPWGGAIAADVKAFVAAAVSLHSDEALWNVAQQQGFEIATRYYSEKELGIAFVRKVAQLRQGLEAHRAGNFIGAMLRHHSMASTRYMGKWIEAKQKSAS